MTEQPGDPWNSLADELGLEPTEASPQPQPPQPTKPSPPPPTSLHSQRAEHSAPPAKKSPADWNALAGSLGLETTANFGALPRDPVAELFGFSPSMPLDTEPRESAPAEREMVDDEFGGSQERYAAEYREESEYREEGPSRSADERAERPRSHRRRGGRGRGRERRDDRGSYDRPRRTSAFDRSDDERRDDQRRDFDRPRVDEGAGSNVESQRRSDEPDETTRERRDRESGGEDRPSKRRRRGRRGRGRSREQEGRREQPADSSREEPSSSSDASLMDEPMEIEFVPIDENGSPLAHEHAIEADKPETTPDEHDHDDDNGFHDEPHGKSSVRDIVTWKEAIGMMIEANIQNHARSPQSGQSGSHHGYHGQRDSRGRGRGRGRGGRR